MVNTNKILKMLVIISMIILLIVFATSPKTHCDACSLDYNGETIDGVKAYQLFEEACISYDRPGDQDGGALGIDNNSYYPDYKYLNIDDIEIGYTEDGILNLTIKENKTK